MEVVRNPSPEGGMLLRIRGRLDANWAPHLEKQIDEVIRGGFYQVQLDLSGVDYISSAGLRVLIKYFRQLQEVNGALTIRALSPQVRNVLEMVGLDELMAEKTTAVAEPAAAGTEKWQEGDAAFELVGDAPDARLQCRAFGDPGWQNIMAATEKSVHALDFPAPVFGLGLGALGEDWGQCRERMGEFMAAGGAVVYQPTDGSNVPDYLLASGALVPRVSAIYGIRCEGAFSHQLGFSAPETAPVTLSTICQAALERLGADSLAFVMLVESHGLVGLALRQSPLRSEKSENPFHYPEIKKWFSFTSEPVFSRHLTLAVGILSIANQNSLTPYLRPLRPEATLLAHIHACAFPYRPLKKGVIDLQSTVTDLFESGSVVGLLHLMHDDRDLVGVGESEFVRGTCWIGAIE
ncbi:STAS domain-containing protein [candidate division KSB1 bacterium]|nr:STAS domain-containing protein [candidate division KSB1 bacterium]